MGRQRFEYVGSIDEYLFRCLRHPGDGRGWSVHVRAGIGVTALAIRVVPVDDPEAEPISRLREFRDAGHPERAHLEAERLVEEVRADGFEPVPPHEEWLEHMVAIWRHQDPGFDVEAIRRQALALSCPSPREVLQAIEGLADVHVPLPGGGTTTDLDDPRASVAEAYLVEHAPLPAVLLALRHRDLSVTYRIESVLEKIATREAVPALLSLVRHPVGWQTGSPFARNIPINTLVALARIDETLPRSLVEIFQRRERGYDQEVVPLVLARFAAHDDVYAALWGERFATGVAFALVQTLECRREPELRSFLESALKSRHESSRTKEAIREAMRSSRW